MGAEEQLRVRTAIVHDWFQGFHGAERVVDELWRGLFDNAHRPDIYTFSAEPSVIPADLAQAIVRQSRIARLPLIRQREHHPGRWRYLLPYMPHYFKRLALDQYDLVLSSSHAGAMHARASGRGVHVCYCHTPMRYAWLPELDGQRGNHAERAALRFVRGRLRRIDQAAAALPDVFVANSTATRDRIQRFYARDAIVVHPPVNVNEFNSAMPKQADRFLWTHRLVPYKQPELVIDAFRSLPFKLTMVGVGPLEATLQSTLPPNVDLLPWLERKELVRLYEKAIGFIHIAEEDFGITMVEALAAGTPVVAIARGGALDILEHGRHGVLIENATVDSVRRAVIEVAQTRWSGAALAARAQEFSRERFLSKMSAVLQEALAARP